MQDYLWYLSYGSNLSKNRFLCYIEGGTPLGSSKKERGCRDTSLPIKDEPYVFSHPLYFARNSKRWGGGVAFVDLNSSKHAKTFGRMYLITKEQFMDVVCQETNSTAVSFDFNDVIQKGSKVVTSGSYGNILYVGEKDEFPIFTFTSPDEMKNAPLNQPTNAYVNMIISGLLETYDLNGKDIRNYLNNVKGYVK